jgi:hypothetical protein
MTILDVYSMSGWFRKYGSDKWYSDKQVIYQIWRPEGWCMPIFDENDMVYGPEPYTPPFPERYSYLESRTDGKYSIGVYFPLAEPGDEI